MHGLFCMSWCITGFRSPYGLAVELIAFEMSLINLFVISLLAMLHLLKHPDSIIKSNKLFIT